jgi:predicted enzyme related to lactoylglutathione lyase
MEPLLLYLDAVTIPVPDLDAGMDFYCGVLGHELIWRNDAVGQAGLRTPESRTEIVLTTHQKYEPDWKVASVDTAAAIFRAHGGGVKLGPIDIPIGRLAVVEDPFGNSLVVLDSAKGTYQTDRAGNVTGVSRETTP